jgi:hypothetical protein
MELLTDGAHGTATRLGAQCVTPADEWGPELSDRAQEQGQVGRRVFEGEGKRWAKIDEIWPRRRFPSLFPFLI